MIAIGSSVLWLALALSTYSVFAPIVGIAQKKDYLKSVYNCAYATAALVTLGISILAYNLLVNNFALTYVADYTNKALGWQYKLSAVYAGQAGSLLFWGWLIAIFAAVVAYTNRNSLSDFMAYTMSILSSVVWFFVFLVSMAPWLYAFNISSSYKGTLNIVLIAGVIAVVGLVLVNSYNKQAEDEPFAWIIYLGTAIVTMLLLIRFGVINSIPVGTNPFELASQALSDGSGLNPLLQNYGMIFHPPTLFIGFAGFTVPFAFALAALFTGQTDNKWLKQTRLWVIFSWLFLGIGIVLGAQWAYMELSWGGYWAWDPVENASLMPWITGTALVHSVLMQRRKSIFRIWNMFLITITFILCIYGTYLTRSGVVSSVHAFGESPIGSFILIYLAAIFFGSMALILSRMKKLQPVKNIENYFSKEFLFLLTNSLLAIAAVVVFYGTDYTIIISILKSAFSFIGLSLPAGLQSARQVGIPFYNTLMGPLAVIFFTLMGVCVLVPWKKISIEKYINQIYIGAGTFVFITVFLFVFTRYPLAILGLIVVSLMGCVSIWEIYKIVTTKINWDKIGAFVVHLSIAVMFIGIISSYVFSISKTATLQTGESYKLRNYTFRYEGAESAKDDLKQSSKAIVSLWYGNNQLAALTTSLDTFFSNKQNQTVTEPGLYYNLKEDVYIAVTNIENNGNTASFKIFHNPMLIWFWIGSVIMVFGGLLLLFSSSLQKLTSTTASVVVGDEPKKQISQAVFSCSNCGSPYNKDDKFCKSCGEKISAKDVCYKCGIAKKKDAKFCVSCGEKY